MWTQQWLQRGQLKLLVSHAPTAGDPSNTLSKLTPEANMHHIFLVLAHVPMKADPETRIQGTLMGGDSHETLKGEQESEREEGKPVRTQNPASCPCRHLEPHPTGEFWKWCRTHALSFPS